MSFRCSNGHADENALTDCGICKRNARIADLEAKLADANHTIGIFTATGPLTALSQRIARLQAVAKAGINLMVLCGTAWAPNIGPEATMVQVTAAKLHKGDLDA